MQGCRPLMVASSVIIVGDVQHVAACLAVDSVKLVTLQPTLRTGVEHLAARAEYSLRQAQEQGDPDEHHKNREQFTAGAAHESDVAEARGGKRRHREIERINKVFDPRIDLTLADVNHR